MISSTVVFAVGAVDAVMVAAIVFVGALSQMVSGFGFALVAVPLMGLVVDLKTAIVVSTMCGIAANAHQAIFDSRHRDNRLAGRLLLASFLGMPFGFAVLEAVDVDSLRVVIGIVVTAGWLGVARRPARRAPPREVFDWLVGAVSGILATSTSTNGPPLVLLLQRKGIRPETFRATLNTVFCVVGLAAAVMFLVGGRITSDVLVGSAFGMPGLACGILLGKRLRGYLKEEVFWRLVSFLLLAGAASSIVAGIV